VSTYSPLVGKAQRSVHLATHRLNVWDGSVRSGKTVASIFAWLRFVRTGPPGDLLMCGKTERTLKRNIIGVILSMLGKRAQLVEGSGELWISGRRIYLVGANDSQAEGKIRGMTLAGAYVDEATLVPEGMWRMLGTRLSIDGARLFATTNPDNPRHWLKLELDRACAWLAPDGSLTKPVRALGAEPEIDLIRMSFVLPDNPHLGRDYIRNLEAEYTGLWRRRFILGEWVISEGSIYDMWDPGRHLVEPRDIPHDVTPIAVGVDYGTRHTFAAEMLAIGHGVLWTTDEWRWSSRVKRSQLTSAQYARHLADWIGDRGPEWVFVDPAAADFREHLWQSGMPGVALASNEVAPGIRTMASALSSGRAKISKANEGLVEMIPGYAWDEKASKLGQDKPTKEADDELDAWRYGGHSSRSLWHPVISTTGTTAA
jgi:PBSX family phage terminase large subunit